MIHARRSAIFSLAVLALAGCAVHPAMQAKPQAAPAGTDWATAPEFDVALTDFEFAPSHPTFKSGQPVKLVLTNSGSDTHDFSAPAFFAAASYRDGSALPADGRVVLDKGQKAEIDLIPGPAGDYPLECTEFLHALFGMTGKITVSAGTR
jgi:uncharacterized cupredoxin-like copper-binding protein